MSLLFTRKGWQEVAELDSFRVSREVILGRHRYTLFKLGDEVFCTQGSCSHEHSPLCKGIVMDGKVYCEKHGSRFDIRTGKVIDPPATANLKTYKTKINNGKVFIFIP